MKKKKTLELDGWVDEWMDKFYVTFKQANAFCTLEGKTVTLALTQAGTAINAINTCVIFESETFYRTIPQLVYVRHHIFSLFFCNS